MNRLGDLNVPEVSHVKRGANRKRYALFKSDEQEENDMPPISDILKAVVETPLEDEAKILGVFKTAGLSEKGQQAALAIVKLTKGYGDEFTEASLKAVGEASGIAKAFPPGAKAPPFGAGGKPGEEDEDDEAVKAKKAKAAKMKHEMEKADDGLTPEVRARVEKAEGDARDAIAKADAKADAAEKIAKSERDLRVTREYVAKAGAEMGNLTSISTADLGAVLKSLSEKDPESLAKLEPVLKAASIALKKSALLQELGRPGDARPGSVAERVEKLAREAIAKSADGKPMSREAAIAKVYSENPALYDEYEAEHKAALRGV